MEEQHKVENKNKNKNMIVAYLTELTDVNYNDFVKEGIAIVDIWAPWCNPCKQISPIIDQLSIDFVNKAKFGKLDADSSPETVTILGIRSIPTILIYKDGEIVDRIVGLTSKQKISDLVNQYL